MADRGYRPRGRDRQDYRGGRGSYSGPRGGGYDQGGDQRSFLSGPPPSARGYGSPRYSEPRTNEGRGRGAPRHSQPRMDDARGGYGQRGASRGMMPPPRDPPPGRARGWHVRGGRQPSEPTAYESHPYPAFDQTRLESREAFEDRTPSQKSYDAGSDSDTRSLRVGGSGDVVSPAASVESLSEPARQKKSHPFVRTKVELTEAMSQLQISRVVHVPSRPDEGGTSGQRTEVISNCWDLSVASKVVHTFWLEALGVYRNDKDGEEQTEIHLPPKEKRALLQQVVDTLPPGTVFDGGHTAYSQQPIEGVTEDTDHPRSMIIKDPLNRESLVLKYRLQEVQVISTADIENFIVNEKATSLNMPQECIRVLDCVLKTICKGAFASVGRNALFYTEPAKVIRDKLFTIHRGFITSVRPQWKVRINVDMTCKAFFTAGNLADVMYDKYGDNMARCSQQMTADLRSIRVETLPFYKNESGGTYARRFTVHAISPEPASSLIIPDLNQSVAEYYAKHHGIQLKYPDLPCAKVNMSRDVFIPMELLNVLPYQSPNASKGDIASEVIRCSAVKPNERFQELQIFVDKLLQSDHLLVKQYGIKVNPHPLKLPARVLNTPTASFGRQLQTLGRGKWMAPSFFEPASKDGGIKWAILSFIDRNAQRHQQLLANQLPRVAQNFSVVMERPDCAVIQSAELTNRFRQLQDRGIRLVLLVLYDDFTYPTIKRLGDLQTGMRTQCVRGRTLDKPNVIPNLLLKINGKLGGINWQIQDVLRDDRELIMVFGADVTHPSPTQTQKVPGSIAAVLGSVTPDLMRYAVVVRRQATTKEGDRKEKKAIREIIDSMEGIISELLKTFYRNTNGRLPNRLIFYRDGVSEGQFENVLLEELAAIQRACSNLRQGYEPAITYIVVQKRHHVRFQPTNPRLRNVEPGTVVDSHVTHPREFDFYLCSQEGIQGTSKPAHYHVLYDDSNWSSDALQSFTFALCHTYMRCPRSVSYPAPTYYAHLAAFRARDWISDLKAPPAFLRDDRFQIHESQITGMYYL